MLIGNVGSDPEIRATGSGTRVAKMSLATSYKRKDGEEKTEWHRLTFFGRLTDIVEQWVKKGDRLYVEGRIQYSQTEGEGGTKYWTDIVVNEMIMMGSSGPPMRAGAYNNNVMVFQTPGYVTILNEMRLLRLIPIVDVAKPPFAQLAGVSRGHWEGETLVIETTQFRPESRGTGQNMHLVERLTRLDPDTVAYEYTVTDPTVYTAPYTVMMPLRRTDGPIFEYACHEGNIGLHGILAGARNLERLGRELRR